MQYIYPAIIHEDPDGLWAEFPDLLGCQTFADTLDELLTNASEALACELVESLARGDKLPAARPMQSIPREETSYPTLIRANINLAKASRSVKKTLTIPAWLNDRARSQGINFSKTLHDALLEKIG
ncbi:type II toxin-antitoxin system HicB family antitoxin [Selenomonas massiliensis]|uniref:type II toxin-antitoxin system HicB family antitoxin n=1 Tax=Selenomonas massiliensis TaxID=2058293 RepID=UPI000D0E9E91|nr:type II toxin-antitoxin system HicB family antitoxin [Selenomonas massiliensis]